MCVFSLSCKRNIKKRNIDPCYLFSENALTDPFALEGGGPRALKKITVSFHNPAIQHQKVKLKNAKCNNVIWNKIKWREANMIKALFNRWSHSGPAQSVYNILFAISTLANAQRRVFAMHWVDKYLIVFVLFLAVQNSSIGDLVTD